MLRKDVLLGEDNEVRREAMEEIRKWAAMEKVLWWKKSTDLWLKEGDKNTKVLFGYVFKNSF